MNDLISREAAIEAAYQGLKEPANSETWHRIRDRIEHIASDEPEIIKCALCKWFRCIKKPDGAVLQGFHPYKCLRWNGECYPTDFCSYAESD